MACRSLNDSYNRIFFFLNIDRNLSVTSSDPAIMQMNNVLARKKFTKYRIERVFSVNSHSLFIPKFSFIKFMK